LTRFDFEGAHSHEEQGTSDHFCILADKIAATTLGETGGDALSDKQRTMILGG